MRFRLALVLAIGFVLSYSAYHRVNGIRRAGIFPTDPPTPYFQYTPPGPPLGRILVVHGLSASKDFMNIAAYGLADAGFEVFSIDLPGHGASRAGFEIFRARAAVESVMDRLGPGTTVLGHSLGAGLLLDIAQDREVGNLVLFSPAPIPLDRIRSPRILIFEGQFDPGRIQIFAPRIEAAATGTAESRTLPWTGHSGGLFSAQVLAGVGKWIDSKAGTTHTQLRLALLAAMAATSLGATLLLISKRGRPSQDIPPARPAHLTVLRYVFAAFLAMLAASLAPFTAWLKLFVMDYLAGIVFLAGGLMLAGGWKRPRPDARAILAAGLSAGALIAGPLLLAGTPLAHLEVSGGRWWRFAALTALGFPLLLADETILRPLRPWWKAAGLAAVTRLVLVAAILCGALLIRREDAFILLLSHVVAAFWIVLWLAGEALRGRTDNPLALALFGALVQGWIFAAVFVVT